MAIALRPIDLRAPDVLRRLYGDAPLAAGRGLTVGIVDTGVGDHPDLAVAGGANTVQGEKDGDWRDNGTGHGTHVAAIVAGRGIAARGVRGLAPGVRLRSYRVFGKGAGGASNYAILKALDRAVAEGCDLVNMSLGGPVQDEATRSAILDARAQSTLVICAAGNDGRGPVAYPGAEQLALAVSAMGRKGTFPADSTHAAGILAPYGKDRANFIAAFSNVGAEIDLTAPGVAVVSAVPGGYAAWDGTSMACPAVTGAAARTARARAPGAEWRAARRARDRLWLRGGFPDSFLARGEAASLEWRQGFVRTAPLNAARTALGGRNQAQPRAEARAGLSQRLRPPTRATALPRLSGRGAVFRRCRHRGDRANRPHARVALDVEREALEDFGVRPRPDHVAPMAGSRYFGATLRFAVFFGFTALRPAGRPGFAPLPPAKKGSVPFSIFSMGVRRQLSALADGDSGTPVLQAASGQSR